MPRASVNRLSNGKGARAKKPSMAKASKTGVASEPERVVLNLEITKAMRAGLNRLKLLLGMPNQRVVLERLIRHARAAANARWSLVPASCAVGNRPQSALASSGSQGRQVELG